MPLFFSPVASMTKTEVPAEVVCQDKPFLRQSPQTPSHWWVKEDKGVWMSPQFTQKESKGLKVSFQAGKHLCNLRERRPCVYRLSCTRSMLCFPPRGARAPQGSSEKVQVLVAQLCPSLWDTMDCSLQGSSVHEILQARILEWATIPFSRGSSRLRDWTRVSCIASGFFTIWATREATREPRLKGLQDQIQKPSSTTSHRSQVPSALCSLCPPQHFVLLWDHCKLKYFQVNRPYTLHRCLKCDALTFPSRVWHTKATSSFKQATLDKLRSGGWWKRETTSRKSVELYPEVTEGENISPQKYASLA